MNLGGPGQWRIVYRIVPDEQHPIAVEIIAIRRRADVYEIAATRMREKRGRAA